MTNQIDSAGAVPRLAILSDYPAPHMLRLTEALAERLPTRTFFYVGIDESRPSWWKQPMPICAEVLPRPIFYWQRKYLARGLIDKLEKFAPTVVVLGGFSIPSNYLVYLWAKRRQIPVIVFTERSRDANGNVRKRNLPWIFLRWLYRDVDLVMASSEDVVQQIAEEFRFGAKVVVARYAADLNSHMQHGLRTATPAPRLLFANRLVAIYNPLMAIRIFARVWKRFPAATLRLNADGPLRSECQAFIEAAPWASSVTFIDGIASWDMLHRVYSEADVLILPAKFSNGNHSVVEAMASGLGIVISDKVLGMDHLIENGRSGFRCPLDDELFAANVMRFIDEPHLLSTFASDCRRRVAPYLPSATADHWIKLLENAGLLQHPSAANKIDG